MREHRGWIWVGAGVTALGLYGFVATLQPDANFGRILAAYGGVFVAGSLAWGMVMDGFRPDRYDIAGALVCLLGVAIIMYSPAPSPDNPNPADDRGQPAKLCSRTVSNRFKIPRGPPSIFIRRRDLRGCVDGRHPARRGWAC